VFLSVVGFISSTSAVYRVEIMISRMTRYVMSAMSN